MIRRLGMDELNRKNPDEFKRTEKFPVIILLDNVRSLHNVGAAFRTGDAFLIEKIILCGITGTPPNREITKTALGATETVAWEHFPNVEDAVKKLKNEGYKIISIEQAEPSTQLDQFIPKENTKYVFVFGNEVFGVSDEVLELTDECIEIPQYGTKHSLNVSVTVGIILWHYHLKKIS